MSQSLQALQKSVDSANVEIDMLRRRIKALEAQSDICGHNKKLHPECRIWLVMNNMLKAKHKVRRDGR